MPEPLQQHQGLSLLQVHKQAGRNERERRLEPFCSPSGLCFVLKWSQSGRFQLLRVLAGCNTIIALVLVLLVEPTNLLPEGHPGFVCRDHNT